MRIRLVPELDVVTLKLQSHRWALLRSSQEWPKINTHCISREILLSKNTVAIYSWIGMALPDSRLHASSYYGQQQNGLIDKSKKCVVANDYCCYTVKLDEELQQSYRVSSWTVYYAVSQVKHTRFSNIYTQSHNIYKKKGDAYSSFRSANNQ